MNPTIMTARVSDQHLSLVNVPLIASGGVDVIQIRFEFCGLWDGCGKTAVFYRKPEEVYHVPIVDSLATVPWEVLVDEGYFYFGVFGAASNIRPTEILKVKVVKGAITTATADPQEPTPDIYEQLLAGYGVLEQQFAAAIAMPGTSGPGEFIITDDHITGQIVSNGAGAHISVTITGLSLSAGAQHQTSVCIPPEWTPLFRVPLETSNANLKVALQKGQEKYNGWSLLVIQNAGSSTYTADMETTAWAFYPLGTISIPELADVRVGKDGTVYSSAGASVRQQIADLEAKIEGGLYTFEIQDNGLTATFFSNGVACSVNVHLDNKYVIEYDNDTSNDHLLPLIFAPLDSIKLEGEGNVAVSLYVDEILVDEGVCRIRFTYYTEKTGSYTQDNSAYYPVGDPRIGYDGTVYGSAGEAVRQQMAALDAKIAAGGGGSGEGGVLIDATLTQEGQAADAKAVGDALNGMGAQFGKILTEVVAPQLTPEVTAGDNGKILQVVDGAWAAVAIPAAENTAF